MTSGMRQKIIGKSKEDLSEEIIFKLVQNKKSETYDGKRLPGLK